MSGIILAKASTTNGNTPAPPRGFPDSEFEARLARAQTLMAERLIDGLLLTTEPEVRYFTGYFTQFWQSPTRPWFVIVPGSGKPVAVIPEIGAECMARTWIDDIRTWPSPHPSDDGTSLLKAALSEAAGATGRIGVPMGRETHVRMPLIDFENVRGALAGVEFVDATDIVIALRMVKSEAEIAKTTHICSIVSEAFEALPTFIHTGMTDLDAFRAFKIEILGRGADDVPYLVGGAEAGGIGDIISPPTGAVIEDGDILMFDTGSVFDGYFSDFDRNYAFGHATDAARRAYDVVYRATEAGLEAARPGATTTDVFKAMSGVMEAGGSLGSDVGRFGHGLGMQLTEWPSNTAFDGTVLEAGMILTLEPCMNFAEGKVMVHEENLVIREAGPQLLSRRAPPELPIIE
jgi:Xaa-Pro aminopeptidase